MIGECLDLMQKLKDAYSLGNEKAGIVRQNRDIFKAISCPRISYSWLEIETKLDQVRVNDEKLRKIGSSIAYMNPLEKAVSVLGSILK